MKDFELARLADLNYAEEFRAMAVTATDGLHRIIQGVPISLTGSPQPAFNVALVTEPLADIEGFLAAATELARAHGVPLGIATREHLTGDLRPHLDHLGYKLALINPSFVLYPLDIEGADLDELTIVTVRTHAEYEAWVGTQASAFEGDLEGTRQVFPEGLAALAGHELYLAYWDGQVAGSATLVVTGSMAGVYGVATLEHLRRRGIGRALTAHCLLRGLDLGCTAGCLQAYEAGRSLYLSMGFRQVASYDCFAPPRN